MLIPENAVLQTIAEREAFVDEVTRRGLPLYADRPKNWDNLIALQAILRRAEPKTSRVLDAGASGGVILPWLAEYGFRDLVGVDLDENLPPSAGAIRYERADLTRTPFPGESFDAITCMSVIEHGVDVDLYLREASRLLRPGGVLVTSTDYWDEAIDTSDNPHGANWRIFAADEISELIARARQLGLALSGPLDYTCRDKVVHWEYVQRDYTFIAFTLVKGQA